jgi:hypothetical protein
MPAQEHQQIVDITVPWVFTSASLLMHVPDESVNIYAVVKPFQWPVKWFFVSFFSFSIEKSQLIAIIICHRSGWDW